MEGRGGIVLLRVSEFQIKLKGIVPGMPNGIIVTHKDGPPAEIQGTEEIMRPPKGRKAGTWAQANTGAAKAPVTMKAASSLPKFCIFSLYTEYA